MNKLDNIKIPVEYDLAIDKAVTKGLKYRENKSKLKLIKIASCGFVCLWIFGAIFPSYAKEIPVINEISKTIDSIRGYFKTNANGETYGTYIESEDGSDIEEPDLIAVIGENNVEGYVKKSDFYDRKYNPETLEEVKKYMKLKEKEPYRVIPVYKEDGVTVIGELKIP